MSMHESAFLILQIDFLLVHAESTTRVPCGTKAKLQLFAGEAMHNNQSAVAAAIPHWGPFAKTMTSTHSNPVLAFPDSQRNVQKFWDN